MNLIGKYKIGKLRFKWHFNFQMSTSRQNILMDNECGCGRCINEKEKVSSPTNNKIGIWINEFKPNRLWWEKIYNFLEKRYSTWNGYQTVRTYYASRRVRIKK